MGKDWLILVSLVEEAQTLLNKTDVISASIHADGIDLLLRLDAFAARASQVSLRRGRDTMFPYHASSEYAKCTVYACLTEEDAARLYPEQYTALQVSA